MTDDIPLKTYAGTSPEAHEIMALVNMWLAVWGKAQQIAVHEAGGADRVSLDPEALSHAMTAAAIMAGTFCGQAIGCGLMKEQDKRRATDIAARNFRSGIDIGKRQTARIAAEMPVAGRA